jgi:hypothetical protein
MDIQLSDWLVSSLRFTSMAREPVESTLVPSMESVFGIQPDAIEQKPKERITVEIAELGPGVLRRVTRPDRVDWLWSMDVPDIALESYLGTFSEATSVFTDPIMNAFVESYPAARLALGGVFLKKADDRVDGYRVLDQLLERVALNAEDSSDFQYQINHPKTLPILNSGEQLLINRLTTWSCARRTVTRMEGVLGAAHKQQTVAERYDVKCEVDINTSADHPNAFSNPESTRIVQQLLGYAESCLLRGDRG